MGWYNASWQYRVKITVDADMVDANLSDYPVYVVYQSGVTNLVDKYNTSGRDGETGTINSITVYAKCKDNGVHNSDIIRTQIWSGSGSSQGAWGDYTTTSYADYSDEYTTSVDTSSAWTWDEVDSLQIGVRLRGYDASSEVRCTQVWAVVDYTPYTTETKTVQAKSRIKMGWYNASWQYRVKITVDADMVDANLSDYPVYVTPTSRFP